MKNRYMLIPILFITALAGCETAPTNIRTIRSTPQGAFVMIETTNQNCITPCTVKLESLLKISVSKEGYETQIFYMEPGKNDIIVELKYIAGSEKVDSTQLPDL